MAFSDRQSKQLAAKLNPKHIKTREAGGRALAYIEGWHAIAEANRIFGFDAWDRETIFEKCVWSAKTGNQFACAYIVKVRISVRADDITIRREGSGSGEARCETPAQAHEIALKSAETDATKRALATFGNPFGLALYDKDLRGVRGGSTMVNGSSQKHNQVWLLKSASGTVGKSFIDGASFAQALAGKLKAASSLEALFDLWAHNIESIIAMVDSSGKCQNADALVTLFKDCARALKGERDHSKVQNSHTVAGAVDKSTLAISEPKRLRCKAHLEFVALQPCLVCGRTPAQAHHLRFAQPRAMAKKVSDEFTVPLCMTHHDAVHKVGDEKRWWEKQGIDVLGAARDFWSRSKQNV